MTREEFRETLRSTSNESLLGLCLRDNIVPHVFGPEPHGWNAFREHLGREVGAIPSDITVVGSARFGFSLKPGKNLKRFSDTSDIDVVVVNTELFDSIWHDLLVAAYPRPPATHQIGGWLAKRRSEVYTGWLTPLRIKLDLAIFGERARPVLEFNARWFNALKSASGFTSRRHEDINGRLYRTWRHAELYHVNSLSALRATIEF